MITHCKNCKKEFKTYPSKKAIFCSKSCKSIFQKTGFFQEGMIPWNYGLKGYRAGVKHPWMPKGENHWSYKKDRSLLTKRQERNDGAYREWRKQVIRRDGYSCRIGDGNCTGKLVAHHILPWSKFPELRYQVNNGIILCRFHHPRKRGDEMKLSPYFQELVALKN